MVMLDVALAFAVVMIVLSTIGYGEIQMNVHDNARLTFRGRELLVKRVTEHGLSVEEAAQASGVAYALPTSGWPGIELRALRTSLIAPRVPILAPTRPPWSGTRRSFDCAA